MSEDRYEIGYRDGGSSVTADWSFAIEELVDDWPDDLDVSPGEVAVRLNQLAREALAQKERAERLEGAINDARNWEWDGDHTSTILIHRPPLLEAVTPAAPTPEGEKL